MVALNRLRRMVECFRSVRTAFVAAASRGIAARGSGSMHARLVNENFLKDRTFWKLAFIRPEPESMLATSVAV